ncbi:metalloregulator ArsR/SmtB family transcription factor [Maritalea mediterranea]|uniref:Metalloregulator ArsR/SmtB family transcription factor n=1 Tax=Maritalea mediterranea TaxID=2909667 RepID=A0ABS9E8I8_9HYPH|nr:metalloregulator ArsR/SmtB family transcription factor [Maritalea mediterranea]MCF4098219.1 metalloregulator ArsR/SmtB family transcription factor [Maritalea mediterranea]
MNAVFEALSHPVRRKIIQQLKRGPKSAGELADMFELTKPTMSTHFAKLKSADLVSTKRDKNTIIYSLNMSILERALAELIDFGGDKDDDK